MASEDITMAGSPENAEQYSFDASSQNQNQMTTHADLNEHDTGSNGDRDSAIDDAVGTSSTTSVTPSVRDCVYENGRAYQGSHADDYFKPKDERAQDNMDQMHDISCFTLGKQFFTAPVDRPLEVLDIGTGTGCWAVEIADMFPQARVTGIDISLIQPTWVPPNLVFQIFDCERAWNFEQRFDFIHIRYLSGAIRNWPALIRQCWEYLKPGGWLEWTELEGWAHTSTSLSQDSESFKWQVNLEQAASRAGKRLNIAPEMQFLAIQAGFQNVRMNAHKIPLTCDTEQDEEHRQNTYSFQDCVSRELAEWSYRLFTRQLGWQPVEVEACLVEVRHEIEDPANGVHCLLQNMIAQKM